MHKTFTLFLASLLVSAACSGGANLPVGADAGGLPKLSRLTRSRRRVSTYHQHVAPILQAKCVTCHAPGGHRAVRARQRRRRRGPTPA